MLEKILYVAYNRDDNMIKKKYIYIYTHYIHMLKFYPLYEYIIINARVSISLHVNTFAHFFSSSYYDVFFSSSFVDISLVKCIIKNCLVCWHTRQ